MRIARLIPTLLLAALVALAGIGRTRADSNLNEVGAFLVYPAVIAMDMDDMAWETYLTVTNAGPTSITAHFAFINGDAESADYCSECDFDIPLTGGDTETLIVRYDPAGSVIESLDGLISIVCSHAVGMMTVNIEDGQGSPLTDNVLLGESVVVDYMMGYAHSLPAIPFQGKIGGNGDRTFDFDDVEYGAFPRVIAADFMAPDMDGGQRLSGSLVLFTLDFTRQHPPQVDCSMTAFDASENPFSSSMRFGCWTLAEMCEISTELCYPNLGQVPGQRDNHGWLLLDCRVDRDADGVFDTQGGVHGAILQRANEGTVIRRNDPSAPALAGTAEWGRLLFQSITTGGHAQLELGSRAGAGGVD